MSRWISCTSASSSLSSSPASSSKKSYARREGERVRWCYLPSFCCRRARGCGGERGRVRCCCRVVVSSSCARVWRRGSGCGVIVSLCRCVVVVRAGVAARGGGCGAVVVSLCRRRARGCGGAGAGAVLSCRCVVGVRAGVAARGCGGAGAARRGSDVVGCARGPCRRGGDRARASERERESGDVGSIERRNDPSIGRWRRRRTVVESIVRRRQPRRAFTPHRGGVAAMPRRLDLYQKDGGS